MSQPAPDPDSPFAEFAQPKESAVEKFMHRKLQDHKNSVARRQLIAFALAGSVLGSSAGVGIGAGPAALPAALGLAVAGALAGVLVGWLVGIVLWTSALIFRKRFSQEPFNSLAPGGAESRWEALSVWLTLWAGVGIVCGAAFGATQGAEWTTNADLDAVMAWAMCGAALGFTAGVGWWFARRPRDKMAGNEPVP